MIDLYKLEIFTVVVQEGSFSRAAERLLMTQSAISQHVQDLEASFGTTLFTRGRRGVSLTASGEKLFQYAQKILALVAEAVEAVTDVSKLPAGQVSISATPGVGVYLLPDWVQSFRNQYPNLTVSLQTGVTSQVMDDIRKQRVDLAFVEGEIEESPATLKVTILTEAEQFVVVGPKHPWWQLAHVQVHQLTDQPLIVRPRNSQTRIWLDEQLVRHNIKVRISAEFDNLESIKRSVMAGQCLSILPDYVVQHEQSLGMLRLLPIQDAPFCRSLKLVRDRRATAAPAVQAFLRMLGKHYPQVLTE